jgi:hypothetical protein
MGLIGQLRNMGLPATSIPSRLLAGLVVTSFLSTLVWIGFFSNLRLFVRLWLCLSPLLAGAALYLLFVKRARASRAISAGQREDFKPPT